MDKIIATIMIPIGLVFVGLMIANSGDKRQWHDHGMQKRRKRPDGKWETRKLTDKEEEERQNGLAL